MNRPVILLLLLSVFLSCIPVGADGELLLTISTDQKTYEAGDRGVMSLIFTNNSGQLIENIHAEIKSKDILFFTKVTKIEEIEWGSETVNLNFQVRKLENGEYPVTVHYSYMQTSKICQGGVCQSISDKKTYQIIIKNGEPRISLETNTLNVENNKTQITFRNTNEVAIDFQFEITPKPEVTLQYESYIGYLLTSSSTEIIVYGEPGEYDGTVQVTFRDRFDRNYTREYLVRIVIKGEEEPETPMLVIQPKVPEEGVRKIEINVASASSTPLSQYYVYFIMVSCLSLIGISMAAKLKNLRK